MSEGGRGRVVGWILLALAGLAVAVALSVAASSLATQPIGLSGEPLRAGDRLAPAEPKTTTVRAKPKRTRTKSQSTTTRTPTATTPVTPAPTQTATTPVPTRTSTTDDSSGKGSGEPGDDHGGLRHSGDD